MNIGATSTAHHSILSKWGGSLLLALAISTVNVIAATPGNVYFVLGSDTAIWNYGTTVNVYVRHPHYAQTFFTDPTSPAFQVMDPVWRNQFKDSYGQPIKFTWWFMGGNIFRDADNINVPVPNSMVLHLMKKYQGNGLRQFGDEMSLHYHTFRWSDYNLDGTFYWNQTQTFEECRQDFDYTLSEYLLDEGVFPVSFRSGWHFMDNGWQSYLNEIIPFSMHNNYPTKQGWDAKEPTSNVQNWSSAPSFYHPFHPSTTNYQVEGDGKGWNLRSIKMQNLSQNILNDIFRQASNGVDQIVCFWNHLPEQFVNYTARTDLYIQTAASNYSSVKFRYCTAVEGMQRWMHAPETNAPTLDVVETTNDDAITLNIQTDCELFQPRPFVAFRDVFQQYSNITSLCVSNGVNSWSVTLPVSKNLVAKIGVAAVDEYGNLSTKILRHLPDDLYIDTTDLAYSEPLGNWTTTANAAWGTNARIATLTSDQPAQACWQLAVSQSRLYSIAIQSPAITNNKASVTLTVTGGTTNLCTAEFPKGIPTGKWVNVGIVPLDVQTSNFLTLSATAPNGASNCCVAANVIRLLPLPDAGITAPIITRQPDNDTNQVGTGVELAVDSFSFSDASYQWYFQNSAMSGKTNSTLTISHTSITNAGDYFVVVSNGSGTVTSAVSILTVNRPPTVIPYSFITLINQSVQLSKSCFLGAASDPDGDPLTLSFATSTSFQGSVKQINSEIIYTPSEDFTGQDKVTYTISDRRGGSTTVQATVLVLSPSLPAAHHILPFNTFSGLHLIFAGEADQTCHLERSSDLITWDAIEIQVIPTNGIVDFVEPVPASTNMFYRIAIP